MWAGQLSDGDAKDDRLPMYQRNFGTLAKGSSCQGSQDTTMLAEPHGPESDTTNLAGKGQLTVLYVAANGRG